MTKLLVKQNCLFWLLRPLSWVYGLITDVRNWLFDKELFTGYAPDAFSVSVGNLTVGGTGKTPMTEYLIKRQVLTVDTGSPETATLSRGYGRQTKGFREAGPADTAATIGDEPLQLYRKFGPRVRVFVGERRAPAIQRIQASYPAIRRILLDDAYQHRAVRPHLNVLLMDYNRPFYTDHPFPAGRLRERRHGARRADCVVVTKCPIDLPESDTQPIREAVSRYTRTGTPVFFAGLHYGRPVSFATGQPADYLREVVLVSGLASADPLEQYVRQTYSLKAHIRYADHRVYTRSDIDSFRRALTPGVALLTTEKDWVKLDALLTPGERDALPLYYLPVELVFLGDDGRAFNRFVTDASLKFR